MNNRLEKPQKHYTATEGLDWNKPLVTIHCTVYNHEPFLRNTLEGFVMQETTFPFETIVHDDASTDNSADIIREYAKKFPHIIKPIYQPINQYSLQNNGVKKAIDAVMSPYSRYIAICEGDDYWIKCDKLEIQVTFLEENEECIYSCHRYEIYDTSTGQKKIAPNVFFENNPDKSFFIFNRDYTYLSDWVTKTLTAVYRKDAVDDSFLSRFKYSRDVHLVYNILSKGKGVCFSFIGGVYNKNSSSIYGSLSKVEQLKTDYTVYKEFFQKTHDPFIKRIRNLNFSLLIERGDFSEIKSLCEIWLLIMHYYHKTNTTIYNILHHHL